MDDPGSNATKRGGAHAKDRHRLLLRDLLKELDPIAQGVLRPVARELATCLWPQVVPIRQP